MTKLNWRRGFAQLCLEPSWIVLRDHDWCARRADGLVCGHFIDLKPPSNLLIERHADAALLASAIRPLWPFGSHGSRDMRSFLAANSEVVLYRGNDRGFQVLDMGCGDGARAIALASHRFNHVTGVDATQNLIDLAIRRAAKCEVHVTFVCCDPCATPFEHGTFDEVMILGGLFGHSGTASSDVSLLREARRVLKSGGRLHLSFADGNWIRANYRQETMESLPAGFIYRYRTLSRDGRSLRTEVLSTVNDYGTASLRTMVETLYTPREISDLLLRLGLQAITYDAPPSAGLAAPQHVVHARSGHNRLGLQLIP